MKNKISLILATALVVITSTTYYWEEFLGFWLMPLTLVLFLVFVLLFLSLLFQVYLSVKEKFSSRSRIVSIIILIILLGLIFYQPFDLESAEARDIFIASREGSANCTITYKLKEDNRFTVRSVCFGIDKIQGNYSIEGDTIRFKDSSAKEKNRFEFGIINPAEPGNGEDLGIFILYRSANDTIPLMLTIFRNELRKLPS